MSTSSTGPPGATPDREAVPPGIDAPAVTRFFEDRVAGASGPLRFSLISGGKSNLTYRVEPQGGGATWVLRRPPLGHVLPTAHDMAREYRVLSALQDTDVPTPRPLALCTDTSVNGATFYVMEYVPGYVLHDALPDGYATTADERRRMAHALVGAAVALHGLDFEALGLGDFGRPEGYLERQVRRWAQQWERSKTREVPAIEELARRLRARLPASPPPSIVHGDYRFGNMALDPGDPGRIRAIFDWEMSTLGDPLTDLGYTLLYWGEPGDPPERLLATSGAALTAAPGFPSRAELTEEYARRSGRDVSEIGFYEALAHYKLAVIAEGIHARFRQGKTVGEGFGDFGAIVDALVEQGLGRLPA